MSEEAFAVWITGFPASGTSTIRERLVADLTARGVDVAVLESDELRRVLGGSYDDQGREVFYGAMVWIGSMLTRHGVPVIFDATANRRSYREAARRQIPNFIEVFVDTPLEVCVGRDPKGIYSRGQQDPAGTVPGLQADYEPPTDPDVHISTQDVAEAASAIVARMVERGFIRP